MSISIQGVESVQKHVSDAQSCYVLIPQQASLDQIMAGVALSQALKQAGKAVYVASPTAIPQQQQAYLQGTQVGQNIGNRNLVVTLQLTNTDDIDKVSYHVDEEAKTFNLVVQPKAEVDPIPSDKVSYSYTGAQADVVITIGARSFQDFGHFYETEKKLFDEATTINISTQQSGGQFTNQVITVADATSYSEAIFHVISQLQAVTQPIVAAAASQLLVGIDAASNRLTNTTVTADTFETVASLMRAGGTRMYQPATQTTAPQANNNQSTNQTSKAPAQSSPQASVQNNQPNSPKEQVPSDWLAPKVYKGSESTNNSSK